MGGYATDVRVVWRLRNLGQPLAVLAGGIVLYALCSTSYYVLRGFFHFQESTIGKVAGWIGGPAKWLYTELTHAEQKVTSWLGKGVIESEHMIGWAFHDLALLVRAVGHEIYAEAVAYANLVEWVVKVDKSVLSGEAWQEIFHNTITSDKAQSAAAARTARAHTKAVSHADSSPIGAGVAKRTRVAQAGVDHTGTLTLPGLRDLTRQRENALDQDIESVRARVGEAERGVERLWDRVRHLDKVTTGVLASALVATALGRLGAGWIRCSNWRKIGRAGCRFPAGALDGLLALLVAEEALRDLPSLVREMQLVARETVVGIQRIAQV